MSAPELTQEKPAAEQPVVDTATPMETDAPATTEVKPETTVAETEVKAEETPAVVPEFPEALRGKTDEEIEDVKKRIVERLTFYFSDSNLFYDKFLWTLVCKSAEGWVPLETVASFRRMREYLQTYGLPFIAQAVRDVHPAAGQEGNEIEVDAEGKQVRRTKSLEKDTSAWDRTVYVKGFGAGETEHNSQEQVEEWFKQFAPVNAVRFRREGEGADRNRGPFKGSVFAEFRTLPDAQKFVDMDPKPDFQGVPVEAMFKSAYVDMKVKDKGIDPNTVQRNKDNRGAGKQFSAFREIEILKQKGEKLPEYVMNMGSAALLDTSHLAGTKRKRDGEDEGDRVEKKPKENQVLTITYNNKQIAINRATGVVLDKNEIEFAPGRVLRFENAGPEADWKQLKQDLQNLGFEKSFMNFPRGSTWGWFSLEEPISDEDFEKIKDAKLQAGGELQWSRVTGDEEVEFWAARASFQGKLAVKQADEKDAQRAEFSRDSRGGRGRGGRGGQRGGRGRGGRGSNRGGGRGGSRGGHGRDNNQSSGGGKGGHADHAPLL